MPLSPTSKYRKKYRYASNDRDPNSGSARALHDEASFDADAGDDVGADEEEEEEEEIAMEAEAVAGVWSVEDGPEGGNVDAGL